MKLSDFRIGNLVNEDHFVKAITLENELTIWNKKGHDYLTILDIEPIVLTEEWLLKFGFIKNKYQNKDSIVDYIDNNTGWFTLAEKDGYFCLCEYRDFIGKQFKYVHQLQNLYFALAGEELTLKE